MLDQSMVIWGDRGLARPAPRPYIESAFQSDGYMAAFQETREGLRRGEPLIVITGRSGTGKTLLCRSLLELGDHRTFTSFVIDPCESPEGLLLHLLTDFGVADPSTRMTKDEAIRVLQRFLASLSPIRSRAIVVIDEAHRLQPEVADTLRVLANLETNGCRVLQIVLAGRTELDTMLQQPHARGLAERVSRHVAVAPLASHEIAGYVEHRLSFAHGVGAGWQEHVVLESGPGYSNVITVQVPASEGPNLSNLWFTPAAIRALERASGGVPGVINGIFDRAVEISSERQTSQIDARIIREAARRLDRRSKMTLPKVSTRAAIAAAVVAAVVVTGAAAFARAGIRAQQPSAARVGAPAAAAALPVAMPALPDLQAAPVQTADSVTVSIASFRTEQRARTVAAQLVDAGFPAFVRPRGDGLWQQVIVGPYVSREEATAAQRAMAAQGVVGTEVRLERTNVQ